MTHSYGQIYQLASTQTMPLFTNRRNHFLEHKTEVTEVFLNLYAFGGFFGKGR